MSSPALRAGAAVLLAASCAPAAFSAGGALRGTVIERERVDGSRSLGLTVSAEALDRLPTSGRNFDEILLALPKSAARGARAGYLPEGWQFDASRLRLSGPAIAGGDFRFDFPRGWKPPAKLGVDCRLGGESVFEEEIKVESRPAVSVYGDYSEWLELPRALRAGSTFRLETLARDKLELGLRWELRTDDPVLDFSFRSVDERYLESLVPNPFLPGGWHPHRTPYWPWDRGYDVIGRDRWGDVWVESRWHPIFLPPWYGPPGDPAFDGATEIVAPNSQLCVCGRVPDLSLWSALSIGGRPLGLPAAACDTSAVYPLPKGLALGSLPIEYEPWRANGRSTGLATTSIRVEGSINDKVIQSGGSTPLTLAILGTDRSFPVRLSNKSTSIIRLQDGPEVSTATSGGSPNQVVKKVTGLRPGQYQVSYRVDLPSCPCDAGYERLAENVGSAYARSLEEWARALAALEGEPPALPPATSEPPALIDGRFRVSVDFSGGTSAAPTAGWRAAAGDTAYHFFDADDIDVMVKVLNGCAVNDRFWVFAAATTEVEVKLSVTDSQGGGVKSYRAPIGATAPAILDTEAFATCP
jgi:hypothetical protein